MMDQETLNQNAPALSPEDQADQEQEQDEVINWSDEEDEELNSAEAEPVTKVDSTPQTTLKSHISHLQQPHTLPRGSSTSSVVSNTSTTSTSSKQSKHRPPQLWEPKLVDTEVSSYELEREARIAQNRAVLLSLGVLKESTEDLVEEAPKPKKSHKKKKPTEEDLVERLAIMADVKRSKRLQGENPDMVRGGRDSELGLTPEQYAAAFSDSDSENEDDDDDIFDHAGMIGMSKIRKRRLGAGVDLVGGLKNDFIQVNTPFTLGFTKLTIWELGIIVTDPKKQDDYWSQRHCRYRHQYPVGFKATKSQYGYDWTMTIEEGEDGPVFRVVADDEPDLPEFTGPSPTSPWTEVCKTVLGTSSKTRVSGPHQYGFTDPFLQAVLFGLPNHPRIEDMTTLRLVSRQARRGVRFGGRDGAKKKRGRPKGQLGLAEDLADNVIVVGGMQSVNWEAVLEEERDAELKRREERRVKAEAEEKERKKREPSFNGFSSGSGGNTVSSSGKVVLKAEELEAALRGAVVDSDTEMVEVEVEVEEEIVDETEVAEPRIVNGREFRARKPPKKFRKVIKKVLVPKKKKGGSSAPIASDADDEPTSSGLPVIQKILSNVPPEILKRSQDPDDDVIYCICDLPDADVWNTVACDFCNIWYHIDCVGYMDPEIVPKSLHSSIKGLTKDGKWKCPRCRKEVLLIPTPLA